jgi:plasmid stability protein
MSSLLIKNIPSELHARLKQRAAKNRRSINAEIILILETAVPAATEPRNEEEIEPSLSDEHLAAYPAEIAAKLRAFRDLGRSMAARNVDFEEWRSSILNSRH